VTVVLPPPPALRTASRALLLLATLALLSGVGTTALLTGLVALDPLLAGDLSLMILVGVLGLGLTAVGAAVPLLASSALREGRPLGLTLLTAIGAGLCLTPLFLVGAWLVWVAAFDPETRAWAERMRLPPPPAPSPPSPG